MRIGDIVPRAGIEPTPLRFRASTLTIIPPKHPDVTTLSTPISICGSLSEVSVDYYTTLVIDLYSLATYDQAILSNIYTSDIRSGNH